MFDPLFLSSLESGVAITIDIINHHGHILSSPSPASCRSSLGQLVIHSCGTDGTFRCFGSSSMMNPELKHADFPVRKLLNYQRALFQTKFGPQFVAKRIISPVGLSNIDNETML